MTDIDTSAEAVERLATQLANLEYTVYVDTRAAVATLRALARERDEARAALEQMRAPYAVIVSREWKAGAQAMRQHMAQWLMCGCDTKEQAEVVAAATTGGPNCAARWRACHRSDCLTPMAVEALALPIPERPE